MAIMFDMTNAMMEVAPMNDAPDTPEADPGQPTFRTKRVTNRSVRAAIGRAMNDLGGETVTADAAIAEAFALVADHWAEYIKRLSRRP